jgi:AcrR family transcriptional regulator
VSVEQSVGKREQTKQANRAAILEAGREVFAELGFGAASVRDIVRRTELATGTFYNYFPDKEAVFRALIEDFGEEARRRVRSARRAATDARGFVEDSYRSYFEYIVEDPATFEVLQRNSGTMRAMFGDTQEPAGAEELADDLRAFIEQGLIPDIDVEYASATMVAVGVELGQRMIERDPPDVEGAARFASGLFLAWLS